MRQTLLQFDITTETVPAARPLEIFVGLTTADGSKSVLSYVGSDPKVSLFACQLPHSAHECQGATFRGVSKTIEPSRYESQIMCLTTNRSSEF